MVTWRELEQRFRDLEGSLAGELELQVFPPESGPREPWWTIGSLLENDQARETFALLADLAGSKLIAANYRVPEDMPWCDASERWYAEVCTRFATREPYIWFGLAVSGEIVSVESWGCSLRLPSAASARLCLVLAHESDEQPAPAQRIPSDDDFPELDDVEEAVLRTLVTLGGRRSSQWIADSNDNGRPDFEPFAKNACNAALQRLETKGYVDRTTKGSAATPKGKRWVKDHPIPETK